MDAIVGLGANLADRRAALASAAREVSSWGRLVAVSSLYETDPVGPPQPAYLNAALRLEVDQTPAALLESLLAVERRAGRVRGERWGPRLLDLDVLFIDGLAVDQPGLVVPHPRLGERRFALVPLLEVAPAARHPGTGEPLGAWLDRLPPGGIVRVAPPDFSRWLAGVG